MSCMAGILGGITGSSAIIEILGACIANREKIGRENLGSLIYALI